MVRSPVDDGKDNGNTNIFRHLDTETSPHHDGELFIFFVFPDLENFLSSKIATESTTCRHTFIKAHGDHNRADPFQKE